MPLDKQLLHNSFKKAIWLLQNYIAFFESEFPTIDVIYL